jgi:glycosyltransferase involved in cell wall biosynthesis
VRVVYLHQYFLTPDMPGGHRSFEMARRLVRAGYDVHVVTSGQAITSTSQRWRESTEDGIHVHWANVPYSNHMGFGRRMIAFLQFAVLATRRTIQLDSDVIFATSTPLTIAIPALIASTVKRVPYVFEVRDMWPDVPIAMGILRHPVLVWLARRLEMLAYQRAAHVVALAPGMRDDIVAKGIPGARVTVIPNGCDMETFATDRAGPSPRDEHGRIGGGKLIVYAGSIGLVNGVDYLVRVASAMRTLDPTVRFVVIGGGKERERVRALARTEGVLDENFFMLDPMPAREVARWLRASDLAVALISGPRVLWKDAVQNKFFDALAAGVPVASNVDGWQSRIAEEEGVGITLDGMDPGASARKLHATLHDTQWLAGVPARARDLAHRRFHRDALARQLDALLQRIGSQRPNPQVSKAASSSST